MQVPSATEIIDALGGTSAVAAALKIKPPSVHEWRARGSIPDDKLFRLAAEIESKTKWRRWDLRPNDWAQIWPELVGTKGAPKVAKAEA